MKGIGIRRAWSRNDCAAALLLVVVTLTFGLIDPNDQFLSTNDIYIFRQIHAYFDVFSWLPQDIASVSAVVDKFARFVFWFFYYFHGAPPQLYQAPLFAVMEAFGVSFRPLYGQAMVTGLLATTVLLYWRCLRRASMVPAIAAAAAMLVACSPMLTGFSRGFGTIWLVNVAICQALSLYAFLLLREGRGHLLLGLTLTHIVLSDPISFLIVGPAFAAWIVPDRWLGVRPSVLLVWQRLRSFGSWKIWLPPVVAIIAVGLWNILRAHFAAAIPGEQTLFVYPFMKYGGAGLEQGEGISPEFWLRIAMISLGAWAPIAFPAVLAMSGAARRGEIADPFVFRWALISSLGFGLMFYVFSHPGMGSQEMPIVGYPVYTVLPFVTLLTMAIDRLAARDVWRRRAATAVLAGFAAVGMLTTVNYIWQKPLVPGAALLKFGVPGMDFIGLRRPYYGDLAAGASTRYVLAKAVAGDRPIRILYLRKPDNVRFDIFWMYGGLEYGGRWFERRFGRYPKIEFLKVEHDPEDGRWVLQRIEPVHRTIESTVAVHASQAQACAAQACVVLDITGKASDEELLHRLAERPSLEIRRDADIAYHIGIIGDPSVLPVNGATDGRELEDSFRRDFPSLWDYIPPREPLHFLTKFRGASVSK